MGHAHGLTLSALALGAAALGACGRPPAASIQARGSARALEHSNLLRPDYVGSEACKNCHASEYAAWRDSPMHRMTRDLAHTQIHAPFEGATFDFRADRVKMETRNGTRFMHVYSQEHGESLLRVSKVIGGHYREDFVGAQVDPSAPFGLATGAEHILPVSYLIFNGDWRYKGYSVMVQERPRIEPGVVWQQGCIFCHNTVPTFSLLFDDLYGPGSPAYQGSASVELPDDRRFRYQISDSGRLSDAVSAELAVLGSEHAVSDRNTQAQLRAAISATERSFREASLVELGIGCEMCHGGAREHVERPTSVVPSLSLRSDFLRVTTARGEPLTHAQEVNRTCAKCHTVLFSRYPYTWEGGARRKNPGGSTINSGEARDFLLGGCTSQLSCVNCHDPHAQDARATLDALGGPSGDNLCLSCHAKYAEPNARTAHTHHTPGSSGDACLNCHMPKKNMGLAYELTRYHRIGSPTDRARVEGDRPLECALCHADKSVEQIVATMERDWGKHYDRGALRRLYGDDLDVNALQAALRFGKPHEQGTVAGVAGRDKDATFLPLLVERLDNPYPLVRYFVRHAIEQITGRPLEVDVNQAGADVVRRARELLA
ncbi:MAG TPA: cytochrome c3 family protein, partial [Polyangiaceae bacterium]